MEDHTPSSLPRRVLVTGADGRIARASIQLLLERGVQVTALSPSWHSPSAADRVFTANAADEDVVVEALADVDAVAHLGAIPHPTLGSAREVFVGNTSSTFTVLNAAGEAGVRRAVIASSINAFGVPMNRHDVLPAAYPLDEDAAPDHDDPYSLSKWVDESTARWAWRHWDMSVVAFRFPRVQALRYLRLVPDQLRADPVERARIAREGWSYLRLSDAATAVVRALGTAVQGAHPLMIAAPDTLLDEDTEEALARDAPGVPLRRPLPGRTVPIAMDRLEALLGWRPALTMNDPATPVDELPDPFLDAYLKGQHA